MKKVLPALLALALILVLIPGAMAAGSLCFVAVNDTIPLTLPASDAPYYSGGTLFLPYTAFNANPGGVIVSNNVDQNTFVLFTRTSRLVYDLSDGTVTDEAGNESPVTVSYRGGMLYIPAGAAEHFGAGRVGLCVEAQEARVHLGVAMDALHVGEAGGLTLTGADDAVADGG